MEIKYKNKKIKISVKKVSEFGKVSGLMFRRLEKSKALLFSFDKDVKMRIHSCFVFFPFLAIWIDKKNNVLDFKFVKPWKVSVLPKTKYFSKLIEIPLSKKYSGTIKKFL